MDMGSATRNDQRSMTMVTRMMWLHAVAKAGRLQHALSTERGRPVGFLLEHPTMSKPGKTSTFGGGRHSLWETPMWGEFQTEMELTQVNFDQKAMGSTVSTPTTLGTNIYYLTALQGQGLDEDEDRVPVPEPTVDQWSPGLVGAIVAALTFWSSRPQEAPRLQKMTASQWKQHVDSGHINYSRECLTCVMGRGTGRRHGRIRHPEMFSLTLDLAGTSTAGIGRYIQRDHGKGSTLSLSSQVYVAQGVCEGLFRARASCRRWDGVYNGPRDPP